MIAVKNRLYMQEVDKIGFREYFEGIHYSGCRNKDDDQ